MTVEPAVTDIEECQTCWHKGAPLLACCIRIMCPTCYVKHRESGIEGVKFARANARRRDFIAEAEHWMVQDGFSLLSFKRSISSLVNFILLFVKVIK